MCGRVRRHGSILLPGTIQPILKYDPVSRTRFVDNAIWGFEAGRMYNTRSDNLFNFWKKYSESRCIFEVDSFFELNKEFHIPGDVLKIGGIYQSIQFSLITVPSNEIILPVHHRMPLIVNGMEDEFLEGKTIDFEVFLFANRLQAA